MTARRTSRTLLLSSLAAALALACGGAGDSEPSDGGASGVDERDASDSSPRGDDSGGGSDAVDAGGRRDGGAVADAGSGVDGASGSEGGTNDGGGANDGGGMGDGGSTGDGGGLDGGAVALPSCADPARVYGPLPTGVSFPQSSEPGPLMARDTRAFLFLEGSALWTTARAGSSTTSARPSALAGASSLGAFASLSRVSVITFQRAGTARAVSFDGTTFGAEVATPCAGSPCTARAAGDGHVWVRAGTTFHEQTGTTFANRGGGPVEPLLWDVDAGGTVIVVGNALPASGEVLVVWKLAPGAGGWTKSGALLQSDVAAAPTIEGGFQLSAGLGAIAPDGSIHVFSDARCVGTGDRNKTQVYLRSRNGTQWSVETLPDATTLYGGLLSWRHAAFWAGSYDAARYVTVTSPKPAFDGFTWTYPDRRYDVVGRCRSASGTPVFARMATVALPGWTTRGYATFSETGAAAILTDRGLSQIE